MPCWRTSSWVWRWPWRRLTPPGPCRGWVSRARTSPGRGSTPHSPAQQPAPSPSARTFCLSRVLTGTEEVIIHRSMVYSLGLHHLHEPIIFGKKTDLCFVGIPYEIKTMPSNCLQWYFIRNILKRQYNKLGNYNYNADHYSKVWKHHGLKTFIQMFSFHFIQYLLQLN